MKLGIMRENTPSMVAAIFNSKIETQTAIKNLTEKGHFSASHIDVIPPHDGNYGLKLEPETSNIKRTLWKSHLNLGGMFLVFGLVLSFILVAYGPHYAQASPTMTFIAVTTISFFAGLLVAGALSLRPDHDHIINRVRDATKAGLWTVVIHTRNRAKNQEAIDALNVDQKHISQSF